MPALDPAGSFVGRESELLALGQLFASGERLVTVLGPGGVGKTRLALRFAQTGGGLREAGALDAGVVLCDLTEASTLRDFCAALARTLQVTLAPGASATDAQGHLGRILAARGATLLVLDNMDQLAGTAAPAVAHLVENARQLRVLVTSRERLRARGEVLLELPPLPFPAAGEAHPERFAAVQLFCERARAVAPAWAGAPEHAGVVAAIVRRLEGFPLAIELCATRSRVLDPAALLERLERSFDVLAAGARDAGNRHLTLARAIDWSIQLLSPVERAALSQCSVFAGGFTLEAAEVVLDLGAGAPPAIDVIEALVDKSLLRVGAAGPGRFSFYSAIREHAARTLAEGAGAQAAAARHRRYYLELGERLAREAESRGTEARLKLSPERENLAAVHTRALAAAASASATAASASDAAADALRAALVLDEILAVQGPFREHFEALDSAIQAAAAAAVDQGLYARALDARGRAHHAAGRAALAMADLEQALAIALATADRGAEARARSSLCVVLRVAHRLDEARGHAERALALHDTIGLPRFEIFSLGALAAIDFHAGDIDAAAVRFARVERLANRIGDLWSEAMAVAFQGHVHQERHALAEARIAFERAVGLFRAAFDGRHAAVFAGYLAGVRHEQGEREAAREGYGRAATELAELGGLRFEGLFRACLGAAAAELGRADEARAAFATAAELLDRVADPALLLALRIHQLHAVLAEPGGASRALAESAALVENSPLVAASDDLRFALRLLHRAVESTPQPVPSARAPLRVEREARWFEPPGGERTSLLRKRALRLLLRALVDARLRSPGRALDAGALLAVGWPGERVLPSAGTHRVRVAIATLRRLGLRDHLASRDDGYLLDPAAPVELAR